MRRLHIDLLEPRRLLAVIYVDQNSPNGPRDGTSWTKAFKYLQDALAVAQGGDDVRIANGTYRPTTGTDRNATFTMKPGVDLFGGYAGYGANDPNQRNSSATVTTLSGSIGNSSESDDSLIIATADFYYDSMQSFTIDGIRFNRATEAGFKCYGTQATLNEVTFDAAGIIAIHEGLTVSKSLFTNCVSTTAIKATDGITIEDCTFTRNKNSLHLYFQSGGPGLYVNRCAFAENTGSVTLGSGAFIRDCSFSNNLATSLSVEYVDVIHCTFVNNVSEDGAGAIRARSAKIESCTFTNNQGTTGGALAISDVRVLDCVFIRNQATEGGAIYTPPHYFSGHTIGSNAQVSQSKFFGNEATQIGGAIYASGNVSLNSSILVGNRAPLGGAFHQGAFEYGERSHITYSTFTRNSSDEGGAIYVEGPISTPVELTNSIVFNNPDDSDKEISGVPANVSVTHSLITGGFQGTGIIDANPKFITNASSGPDGIWRTADDNYGNLRLQSGSPAIDRGTDELTERFDLAGGFRFVDSKIDLGAFEWQPGPFLNVNFSADAAATLRGTSSDDVISIETSGDVPRLYFFKLNNHRIRISTYAEMEIKVFGNAGNDRISLGSLVPSAYLSGGDGSDTIIAGAGNDIISGGAQRDRLYGGDGNDRIGGNGGHDFLYGEAGDDRIYGDDGDDYLSGGLRVDRLYGGAGNDTLDGGKSNDKLYGDTGSDRLDGQDGNDLISGGSGTDRAVDDDEDSLVTSIEILI